MRFILLLYGDETREAAMGADERRRMVDEHIGFSASLRERGSLVAGEALQPSSEAVTVRPGTDAVTDGPYAESKEQIGGFYLIEAADRDEATRHARQIPLSPGLAVEVRPIADT